MALLHNVFFYNEAGLSIRRETDACCPVILWDESNRLLELDEVLIHKEVCEVKRKIHCRAPKEWILIWA